MEIKDLALLSKKYLDGNASEDEKNRLLQWYNAYDESALTAYIIAADGDTEDALQRRMLLRLQAATQPVAPVRKMRYGIWWAAAASLLIIIGAGTYYVQRLTTVAAPAIIAQAAVIAPGTNKATLTLADGSEVNLDSTGKGLLLLQGKTKVSKTGNGQIAYLPGNAGETAEQQNILRTPRGGQYKVVLSDGTEVWLNAASSITYPAAFTKAERVVSITGEAYFEIAPDAAHPFMVKANGMEVAVLGTHFNINAYADEHTINTTLLQGAVLVRTKAAYQQLLPGEQAQIATGTDKIKWLKKVDVNNAVAWKNGYFSFDDADIPAVMRQLARWYDMEVVFSDKLPEGTFTGEIGRSLTQEQLLKVISQAGIHYSMQEGKRLLILP